MAHEYRWKGLYYEGTLLDFAALKRFLQLPD